MHYQKVAAAPSPLGEGWPKAGVCRTIRYSIKRPKPKPKPKPRPRPRPKPKPKPRPKPRPKRKRKTKRKKSPGKTKKTPEKRPKIAFCLIIKELDKNRR